MEFFGQPKFCFIKRGLLSTANKFAMLLHFLDFGWYGSEFGWSKLWVQKDLLKRQKLSTAFENLGLIKLKLTTFSGRPSSIKCYHSPDDPFKSFHIRPTITFFYCRSIKLSDLYKMYRTVGNEGGHGTIKPRSSRFLLSCDLAPSPAHPPPSEFRQTCTCYTERSKSKRQGKEADILAESAEMGGWTQK